MWNGLDRGRASYVLLGNSRGQTSEIERALRLRRGKGAEQGMHATLHVQHARAYRWPSPEDFNRVHAAHFKL
jgi:hypothetical protein